MTSFTAYFIFSVVALLVGFLLTFGVGGPPPGMATYLFFFGNATAWVILFVVGLVLYGKRGLWLLAIAPIAFFHVGLFVCLSGFCGPL